MIEPNCRAKSGIIGHIVFGVIFLLIRNCWCFLFPTLGNSYWEFPALHINRGITIVDTLINLENHLYSEHPSEYEVHVVEILVLLAEVASQGVLCSQSYRAGTDDYHNKHVKESQVHHEMTQTPKPVIDEIRYGTI